MRVAKKRLGFENLERRELMAADMKFDANSGTLTLTGTSGSDYVEVNQTAYNAMYVRVNNNVEWLDPSDVHNVVVKLGAGNDSFAINANHLDSLDVNFGTGSLERADIHVDSIGKINVDAKASRGTAITMANTSVVDQVFIDMGTDSASDAVTLYQCDVNRFNAKFGGGNDELLLEWANIERANVDMGSGSDRVVTHGADAHIASGVVDCGAGSDTIDQLLRARGKRYERVWSW